VRDRVERKPMLSTVPTKISTFTTPLTRDGWSTPMATLGDRNRPDGGAEGCCQRGSSEGDSVLGEDRPGAAAAWR